MNSISTLPPDLPPELFDALERARLHPEDRDAWLTLDDQVRDAERPDEASALYRESLGLALPREALLWLGEHAVSFHEEWYARPEHAIGLLQRIIRIDAACEWAFERLSLLLTLDERWDELLSEYDHVLANTSVPERQRRLLDEASRIAKDFAGQAVRASAYLKQLLLREPGNDQLAESLERRLEHQGRHEDLIEIWQARLAYLPPAEAVATRVRIAERYLQPLGNAERSLRQTEEILSLPDGEDLGVELLERIAGSKEAAAPARRRALTLLRERYTAKTRADDVIRVLELWLTVPENAETTLELHASAAEWLARSERWAEAMNHEAARLELLPEATAVHEQLRALAERTGRFSEYAAALVAAAEACRSAPRRVELLLEAGQVNEQQLANAPAAIDLFSRVLADAGASPTAQLTAARRARGLLAAAGRTEASLRVLERLAELERAPEARREALAQAAQLADQQGDIDRALSLWQRCLEASERDQQALDARIQLLERSGRFEALIADLRRRARLHALPADQRADWVRIAHLYERELGRVDRSIDVWREIEQQFGSNEETIDAVVRLCHADRRFDDVIERLETALEETPTADRRTRYLTVLGDVFRTERREAARAVSYYRDALAVTGTHGPARDGLRALLGHPDCAEIAVESLATALEREGEWQGVLELLPRRIEAAPTPERTRAIWLEAAAQSEQRANDLSRALGYLCRAFELEPTPALEQDLIRLARTSGDFAQAVDGLSAAIEHCEDAERRLELRLTRGKLLETELHRPEAALDNYRAILIAKPTDTTAACAVARVAIGLGDAAAVASTVISHTEATGGFNPVLIETIERASTAEGAWRDVTQALMERLAGRRSVGAAVEHDLRRQLGIWYRDHRNDAVQATALLSAAVDHRRDPGTLRMLAELQRQEPGRPLVGTLLALADATGDELGVLSEAARVALRANLESHSIRPILERLRDAAAAALQQAATATGSRPPAPSAGSAEGADSPAELAWWALQNLVTLEMKSGGYARALRLLLDGADLPFAAERAVALRYQAATVAADSLGDAAQAIVICRRVLEREPRHAATIALLSRLYESERRYPDLLALRRTELDQAPDQDRRLELRLDEARILRSLGQGRAQQLRALRRNLEEVPGHSQSVDELETLLRSRSAHRQLYALLSRQATLVADKGDVRAAARLWARAGLLSEAQLNDQSRAIAALRASVALAPEAQSLDALARLYLGEGQPSEAVTHLEQRLQLTPLTAIGDRRTTLASLSRALCSAGREADARRYLAAALDQDPAALELRQLLGDLYRKQQDYQRLAPLLTAGVDFAPDDATRVEFLREAARVHRQQLGELEVALPLLRRAVELHADDRGLRLSLADALRQAERFSEARNLLNELLTAFGRRRTPERARVHYQLAQIARKLGDLEAAQQELNLAASVDRDNLHMLKLLGDVARERGKLEEAERAYRTLLLLLGRSRQQETEDQPAIGESSVLFELYRIATERGQSERAKELLDSALEAGAHDEAEAQRLEAALREAGHHDLLLRALEQRFARTQDPIPRGGIAAARAEVLEILGRPEEALAQRLEALQLSPLSGEFVRQTWQLAERIQQTSQVVDAVSALAEVALDREPERACSLWLALSGLCLDSGDAVRASELLARAQSTGLRAYDALAQVERIGPSRQSPQVLKERYRAFIESADSNERPEKYTDILYRLGALELVEGEPEQGTLRIETALARDGDYARGIALLKAALSQGAAIAQVAEVLEQAARQRGDSAALLVALRHRAELGEISPSNLHEAVELARRLSDTAQLRTVLERTVALAHEQGWVDDALWAVRELVALHRQEATDPRVTARLLERSMAEAGPSVAFELKLDLAALSAADLDDLARAATLYEQLLVEEPSAVRVWRPLLAVYRRQGNHEALERRISALEHALPDNDQLRALRLERVRLLLDAKRVADAEAALKRLLEEDPDSDEAADVLGQLLDAQGRHEELRISLEQRLGEARTARDSAKVTQLTLRLGDLLAASDLDLALDVYQASIDSGTSSPELLEAYLKVLARGQGQEERRAQILFELLQQESGARAEARALELSALEADRGNEPGVERALATGLARHPESRALHERFVEWCGRHSAWEPLARHLVDRAGRDPAPPDAAQLLRRAADLYETELDQPRFAAQALERVLPGERSDSELLQRIARAWLRAREPARALSHWDAAVDAFPSRDAQWAKLLQERAKVRLELEPDSLPRVSECVDDLTRASQLDPEGSWGALAQALQAHCRLLEVEAASSLVTGPVSVTGEVSPAEALRRSTMQLCRVLVQLEQRGEAVDRLQAWLTRQPQDTEGLRLLAALAAEAGDHTRAAEAYTTLIPLVTGQAQVDAALRFADVCEAAGTPELARPALEQVHAQQPGQATIRKRLRQMYEQAKAYGDWARLLVADAEAADLPASERFELLCTAGDLFRQTDGGAPQALGTFEKALALKPSSAQALIKLIDVQVAVGEIEQAAVRLEQAIRAHGRRRSPELADLQFAMARVARAAGDEEAVFAWLEAALFSDRQNGAVASELASLAMARGELDVAVKALQLVTLLKVPGPMSRAEAYLRQAAIAKHRGDIKKSALLAKRAVTTDPEYREAQGFLDDLSRLYSQPPPSESR
jgi:tetratricopeptide (TPR) repeat protein